MFRTVKSQGEGTDEVIEGLGSRSGSPVVALEPPVEPAARAAPSLSGLQTRLGHCDVLESLLKDFYQFYFSLEANPAPEGGSLAAVTRKKSPMVMARQKTVGGLVMRKQGARPHYILTFSGNNSETFELYRPLQQFLDELEKSCCTSPGGRVMDEGTSPRRLSPKLEEQFRKIWSVEYKGSDITVELVPEVYLSADLCALVEHRFLPMLKDRATLVETLKQRPLSKWTCCEIKTLLFAIENQSVLSIDPTDTTMTLLAYHYNDEDQSIEYKEPCGCCAQLPEIKESLFGLENSLLSQACLPTPPGSPQRCSTDKVSRTPGRPEKLPEAVKAADMRLKQTAVQRQRHQKLRSGMMSEFHSKNKVLPSLLPSLLKERFTKERFIVHPLSSVKSKLRGGAAPKKLGPKTLFAPVGGDGDPTMAQVVPGGVAGGR